MLSSSTIAIVSAFGPTRRFEAWADVPARLATGLADYGFRVVGFDTSDVGLRTALSREERARTLQRALLSEGVTHAIHLETLELAPLAGDPIEHYLYCDRTGHLALRHRLDLGTYRRQAIRALDTFERSCYGACRHVFTFGDYVAEDLLQHYGLPRERVSAVGAGPSVTEFYSGAKDYGAGRLLFVANLLVEKSSRLLIDAMRIAQRTRPDLTLTMVGGNPAKVRADGVRNLAFVPPMSAEQIHGVLRDSTLLVQPMLDDPCGRLALDALATRTPVIGLDRNGLAEITANGAFGFLIADADARALADAILDAVCDPQRLAQMGTAGQRHVMESFSWNRVTRTIAGILAAEDRTSLAA